jgi:hypothetical protein
MHVEANQKFANDNYKDETHLTSLYIYMCIFVDLFMLTVLKRETGLVGEFCF